MSTISSYPAIDVHAHFGIHDMGLLDRIDSWLTGDAGVVSRRAKNAGIRWSVISALTALCPYRGNIAKGNAESVKAVESHDNLLFWTVIDPSRPETVAAAAAHIDHPKCMGIKMHPFLHQYDGRTKSEPVFEIAAKKKCVILTHSGDRGSYPEDFVPYADDFPDAKLIVAHIGHGDDGQRGRQIQAVKNSKHRNIWADTSSSNSILSGIIEWAVQEIGNDRILCGTDTPLYYSAAHRARIDDAEIDEASKKRILFDNAAALLGPKFAQLPK